MYARAVYLLVQEEHIGGGGQVDINETNVGMLTRRADHDLPVGDL